MDDENHTLKSKWSKNFLQTFIGNYAVMETYKVSVQKFYLHLLY